MIAAERLGTVDSWLLIWTFEVDVVGCRVGFEKFQ